MINFASPYALLRLKGLKMGPGLAAGSEINIIQVSSFSKKTAYWFKRCANIPLLIMGVFFIGLLLLNEDASFTQSMIFEKEIVRLKKEIKENRDSAAYYRNRRLAIERGDDALEYIAREQYHMKRPTEDVFLLVAPQK